MKGNGADVPPTLALAFGEDAAKAPAVDSAVVRGLLHAGSITLIYGKPKSGKSFLATHLALAIADKTQRRWMDHEIKRHGPVVYVACEGHGGYWKRLKATGQLIPDHFVLATGRPKLIINPDAGGYVWVPNPADVLAAVQAVTDNTGPPVAVFIDTVFRSFGGADVNSSAHMNAYIAAAQIIADQGIAVALIHHATKGTGTPSGSVALMGAADTLIRVEGREDGTNGWEVEQAKDDATTTLRGFNLETIDGIQDAFGDIVSSCRVVDLGTSIAQPAKSKGGRPGKVDRRDAVLELLRRMAAGSDDGRVNIIDWREQAYKHVLVNIDKTDTKLKAFNAAFKKMMDADQITADGGYITPC